MQVTEIRMPFGDSYTLTIGGRGVTTAATMEIENPSTLAIVGRAPVCSAENLNAAVEAARAAFPDWAAKVIDDRRMLVRRMAERLRGSADVLAPILSREQGKPLHEALREIHGAAYWCDATADIPFDPVEPATSPGQKVDIVRVPLGVVGAIAPWNHPVILAIFKVAPALVTGNTVILKPSPFTPLATLRMGELMRDVLPPGVLNIISGEDLLGPWMTAHPGIDKITFTGSTQTGRTVMAAAAQSLKRITLELGGNDASIVLPDADPVAIAEGLFWSAFRNSGQACIAAKRLYVHRSIHHTVRDALLAYAATIRIGDAFEDGVRLGPIQNRKQFDLLCGLLNEARAQGFNILTVDPRPEGPGYFLPITIVDAPPEDARIVTEEQFGPILPILPYDDLDAVIAKANSTRYGLGGTVWSADAAAARSVAARLKSGSVWINQPPALSPLIPFGGHRQSGLGVSGAVQGLMAFTNTQALFTAED